MLQTKKPKQKNQSPITKEYFEIKFGNLDKKIMGLDEQITEKITGLDEKITGKIMGLDEKVSKKFADQAQHLIGHANTQTQLVRDDIKHLESEMNTKFDAILELLDVRDRVTKLEEQIRQLQKHNH